MTAQGADATHATGGVRLRLDVLDLYTARKGAHTDADKARLLNIDRATIWRYRTGKLTPSLARAMGFAKILDVPLDVLIDGDAA